MNKLVVVTVGMMVVMLVTIPFLTTNADDEKRSLEERVAELELRNRRLAEIVFKYEESNVRLFRVLFQTVEGILNFSKSLVETLGGGPDTNMNQAFVEASREFRRIELILAVIDLSVEQGRKQFGIETEDDESNSSQKR